MCLGIIQGDDIYQALRAFQIVYESLLLLDEKATHVVQGQSVSDRIIFFKDEGNTRKYIIC